MREGTEVIDDERETPRVASLAASEVMEEVEERQRVRHEMDAPQQSLPRPFVLGAQRLRDDFGEDEEDGDQHQNCHAVGQYTVEDYGQRLCRNCVAEQQCHEEQVPVAQQRLHGFCVKPLQVGAAAQDDGQVHRVHRHERKHEPRHDGCEQREHNAHDLVYPPLARKRHKVRQLIAWAVLVGLGGGAEGGGACG